MEKEPTNHAPEQPKPAIAILVEGGVVQSVVSAGEHVVFRLIDLDGDGAEPWTIGDEVTHQANVDIEVYTRDVTQPPPLET